MCICSTAAYRRVDSETWLRLLILATTDRDGRQIWMRLGLVSGASSQLIKSRACSFQAGRAAKQHDEGRLAFDLQLAVRPCQEVRRVPGWWSVGSTRLVSRWVEGPSRWAICWEAGTRLGQLWSLWRCRGTTCLQAPPRLFHVWSLVSNELSQSRLYDHTRISFLGITMAF